MKLATLAPGAVALLLSLAPVTAQDTERTADVVVAEIEAVPTPELDRTRVQDPAYREEFMAARDAYYEKVDALTVELWELDPQNAMLVQLLPDRWNRVAQRGDFKIVLEETRAAGKSESAELKREAAYWRAQVLIWNHLYGEHEVEPYPFAKAHEAAAAYWTANSDDPRAGGLMFTVAENLELNSEAQRKLLAQIVETYPDAGEAARAGGLLKILDRIGQPVELEFEEAVSGQKITMADLRGKVVVLDFWATWCGPCVAEMPHMKELYVEYKEQGVEFVGISLDVPEEEGGLEKLRKYVADNEVPWPQYYQGAGWESEFSRSWGINSIPALFVIDQEGRLYHPKARGKLEELLPMLLKKSS